MICQDQVKEREYSRGDRRGIDLAAQDVAKAGKRCQQQMEKQMVIHEAIRIDCEWQPLEGVDQAVVANPTTKRCVEVAIDPDQVGRDRVVAVECESRDYG